MKTVIYVSTAAVPFSEDDLAGLLVVARRNNIARAVTGMLIHCDGNFMQVLEGPDAQVDEIFAAIERDPRHSDVRVILDVPIGERQFADWAMAFRYARDREAFEGAVNLVGDARAVAAHLSAGNVLHNVLLGFVERNQRAYGLTEAE